MIEPGHRVGVYSPEGSPNVRLTYAESGLRGTGRLGGYGLSYLRPTGVSADGTGVGVPIRDHVMLVRLVMLTLLVVASIWRWLR